MNRIKIISNGSDKTKKIKNKILELIRIYKFVIDEKNPELIMAIGGDGTFLKALKETGYKSSVCYIGINTGHLGFLQDINIEEVENVFKAIRKNNYHIDNLHLADIDIYYKNAVINYKALNELVLREQNLKVLRADIRLNDTHLEFFVGDGCIISTPTGSTAYNMSAGGSIIYPSLEVLQFQPLATLPLSKHYTNLSSSIVVPKNLAINIIPKRNYMDKILAVIDGETMAFSFPIKKISVKLADETIKILRIKEYDFCNRLNEKFISF